MTSIRAGFGADHYERGTRMPFHKASLCIYDEDGRYMCTCNNPDVLHYLRDLLNAGEKALAEQKEMAEQKELGETKPVKTGFITALDGTKIHAGRAACISAEERMNGEYDACVDLGSGFTYPLGKYDSKEAASASLDYWEHLIAEAASCHRE